MSASAITNTQNQPAFLQLTATRNVPTAKEMNILELEISMLKSAHKIELNEIQEDHKILMDEMEAKYREMHDEMTVAYKKLTARLNPILCEYDKLEYGVYHLEKQCAAKDRRIEELEQLKIRDETADNGHWKSYPMSFSQPLELCQSLEKEEKKPWRSFRQAQQSEISLGSSHVSKVRLMIEWMVLFQAPNCYFSRSFISSQSRT